MLKSVLKDTAQLEQYQNTLDDYGQPLYKAPITIKCVKFAKYDKHISDTSVTVYDSTTVITDVPIQMQDRIDGSQIKSVIPIKTARAKIIGYEVLLT